LEHSLEFCSDERFWQIPDADYDRRVQFSKIDSDLNVLPDVRYKGSKRRRTNQHSKSPVHSLTKRRSALRMCPHEADEGDKGDDDGEHKDGRSVAAIPIDDFYTPAWGACFSGCHVNHIAILLTEYDDSMGISVVQITNIVSDVEGEESFQGIDLCIDSKKINQSDSSCLKAKWYKPSRSRVSSEVRPAWGVLTYFPALVSLGNRKGAGKGIPAEVRKKIIKMDKDENLHLFTMKPEAERSLQKGHVSHDDSDDDDDSS
jgi:hypothetical protein